MTARSTVPYKTQPSYPSVGTYSVNLTVSNEAGRSTRVKGNYITVTTGTPPPEAKFYVSTKTGPAPLTVKFTDTSTGSGSSSWQWDFDDDGAIESTARNPIYTYLAKGTYSVTLTVTNPGGSGSKYKPGLIAVT